MSAELPCHVCGYDLRAHPPDGKCPECGASVAEARRWAAIPRRPAWRDSDPRWRRRMLAGVWVLVFLPLMNVLTAFGLASSVPAPRVFDFRETVRTLDDTLLGDMNLYMTLAFCIGMVLLFSKESDRRRNRLDWTRRWGVLCSYVVFLVSVAQVLAFAAMVLTAIAGIFLSMPSRYQPSLTPWIIEISTTLLYYGPEAKISASIVLVAFSSIAILLACIPLSDALESSGSKRAAAVILVPLVSFAGINLLKAVWCCLGYPDVTIFDTSRFEVFFAPNLFISHLAGRPEWPSVSTSDYIAAFVEAMKWCIVLVIAIWLSIAQFAAWWKGKKLNRG